MVTSLVRVQGPVARAERKTAQPVPKEANLRLFDRDSSDKCNAAGAESGSDVRDVGRNGRRRGGDWKYRANRMNRGVESFDSCDFIDSFERNSMSLFSFFRARAPSACDRNAAEQACRYRRLRFYAVGVMVVVNGLSYVCRLSLNVMK
jgi:hypothetical protein